MLEELPGARGVGELARGLLNSGGVTPASKGPSPSVEDRSMDWKKIAPWNWFKDEERAARPEPPVSLMAATQDPMAALRAEMDQLFEDAVRRSFPLGAPRGFPSFAARKGGEGMLAPLRPIVDISEGRKAYSVRVELPGVEPDDVSLEIEDDNTLILRAEKRREHEEEDEGLHWVESSYGAAQRVLSLPADADGDGVEAKFKNGILKLRIPKHAARASKTRAIEVQQD